MLLLHLSSFMVLHFIESGGKIIENSVSQYMPVPKSLFLEKTFVKKIENSELQKKIHSSSKVCTSILNDITRFENTIQVEMLFSDEKTLLENIYTYFRNVKKYLTQFVVLLASLDKILKELNRDNSDSDLYFQERELAGQLYELMASSYPLTSQIKKNTKE